MEDVEQMNNELYLKICLSRNGLPVHAYGDMGGYQATGWFPDTSTLTTYGVPS